MTRRHQRWGWMFVSPYLISLTVFSVIPLLVSLYLAFTRYDLVNPARWVGLQNFERTVKSLDNWKAFRNTWVYALFLESISISLACVLAVLLNQKVKGLGLFRVIYYIPILTPSTAVTIVWSRLYNPKNGAFNVILGFLGLGPLMFTYSQNWLEVVISVAIMGIWKGVGGSTVYLIGALQAISEDVLEAADIDGASASRKFFKITLPLLTPTIFYLMITGISGALQAFDVFYLLTQGTGSDLHVVNSLVYKMMWGSASEVGGASALGWVSFIFIALITYAQKKFEKKWVHYDA